MIITQTPLRISLFGGGTDLPGYFQKEGGCVLSTAIDKYIYVIVKRRYDHTLRVSYTKTEIVDSVDELQHELIRESMRFCDLQNRLEIITIGDIPSEGSGLGSSSALTVGTLNALSAYDVFNTSPHKTRPETLACAAGYIELEKLSKPIGLQDQYIAAYGGLHFFEFKENGNVAHEKVNLSMESMQTLQSNLLLFFTGTIRKAESVLTEQANLIYEHLTELRELKQMTKYIYKELCSHKNMDVVGDFLHLSWLIKKRLASNISNPDIDSLYETARKAGALGGKLCGAGGGGYLLLYVTPERQPAVREALKPLQELHFNINSPGSKVILNY